MKPLEILSKLEYKSMLTPPTRSIDDQMSIPVLIFTETDGEHIGYYDYESNEWVFMTESFTYSGFFTWIYIPTQYAKVSIAQLRRGIDSEKINLYQFKSLYLALAEYSEKPDDDELNELYKKFRQENGTISQFFNLKKEK